MANLYYDVRLDIQKDTVIDSGLRFTQGDSKVIYLRLAVMNGGVKFDASNTTPSVNFVKPDGTYVIGTPVETGDFWVYQFLGNELQAAGKVLCDIKFTYESGRVSSSKFTFFVEKDTTISGAEGSSSYVAPMEQILSDMKNLKDQGISIVEAAEESAITAESWTKGGTGTREDEDINNSKYWSEQAKEAAKTIAQVYRYKGSVNTFNDLPTTGQVIGDVWNVIDTGMNYAWDGQEWDALGGATSWKDLTGKPFESIDTNTLEVTDNALKVKGTTATSTTDLDNSADGNIRSLHLLGEGRKSNNGLITSEGIVESKNEDNTKSSTINASEILNSTFTGVNDIKDELIVNADGSGKFIKRVEVTKTDIIPLATPTETDLTPQQVSALLSLKTFTDKTLITADCEYEISYYTEFGQVIGDLDVKVNGVSDKLESVVDVVGADRKNLIPYPYYDGMSKVNNGVTFTVNLDGSITANGTASETADAAFIICAATTKGLPILPEAYRGSGINGGSWTTYLIQLNTYSSDLTTKNTYAIYNDNSSYSFGSDEKYLRVAVIVRKGQTVNNLIFKPMLVKVADDGSYPTNYIPPISLVDLSVQTSERVDALIKSNVVSVTTDSAGNYVSSLAISKNIILGVKANRNMISALPYYRTGSDAWGIHIVDANTLQPLVSTEIELTIIYMEL